MPTRILALALLCLALAHPAAARELTPAERETLPGAVETFRQALAAQDVVTLTRFEPPLVTAGIAERRGMTVPDMIETMAEWTAETGATVTVVSIAIDLDAAEIGESGDGEPYLLIPTEIVISVPETGTVRERSQTLAFPEGGSWRLLRLGHDEKRELLQLTYPRFAGVALPESTVEKLP